MLVTDRSSTPATRPSASRRRRCTRCLSLEPFALADTPHPSHRDEDVPTTAVRSSGRPRVVAGAGAGGRARARPAASGPSGGAAGSRAARLTGPVDEAPSTRRTATRARPSCSSDLEQDLLRRARRSSRLLGGWRPRGRARAARARRPPSGQVGLETLDLRYVAAAAADQQDEVGRALLSEDDFVADVELTWQLRGFDPVPASLEVPVVLRDDGQRDLVRHGPRHSRRTVLRSGSTTVSPSSVRPPASMLVQSDRRRAHPARVRGGASGVRTVRDALPGLGRPGGGRGPGVAGSLRPRHRPGHARRLAASPR